MPAPLPDDDDRAADAVADALLLLARDPGALRLAVMQMTGLADEPPTQAQMAQAYGMSLDQLARLERRALDRAKQIHLSTHKTHQP